MDVDADLNELVEILERIKNQTESALTAARSKRISRLAEYQPDMIRVQRLIGRIQAIKED